MDTDKIEMKTLMETAAVADYLTALAKGFKSGSIVVEKDGESLTLIPAETAEVEVEARMKKDKMRFSLEVSWRVAQPQDEPSSLKISAAAPAKCEKDEKCGKPEKCGKDDSANKKTEKQPEPAKAPETKSAMVKVIEQSAAPSKAAESKSPETKPADAHKLAFSATSTSKP